MLDVSYYQCMKTSLTLPMDVYTAVYIKYITQATPLLTTHIQRISANDVK